jgi:peptidoglycan/xylan/chitin deacetylase (PgdA/CDA1 family)
LRRWLAPAWCASGAPARALRQSAGRAVILMYHTIVDQPDRSRGAWAIEHARDAFRRQMTFVRERMNPLPLSELVDRLASHRPLPPNAIAITFDDGYEDNYSYAYPVLKDLEIPATIYLTTGHLETRKTFWWDAISGMMATTSEKQLDLAELARKLGLPNPLEGAISLRTIDERQQAADYVSGIFKAARLTLRPGAVDAVAELLRVSEIPQGPPMLTWKQIAEMRGHGIDFGAHTISHPDLTELSDTDALEEIDGSKQEIESRLRAPVTTFAFPYGTEHHWTPSLARIAQRIGFRSVVSADTGFVDGSSDLHRLRRITLPRGRAESVWTICKHLTQPGTAAAQEVA